MALALFSTEAIIRRKLADLGCAENSFARFNGIVGRTRFFEAMAGKPGKHFSQQDSEQLLRVLDEMEALRASTDIPVDWTQVERIQTVLVIQRVNKIADEIAAESAQAAQ